MNIENLTADEILTTLKTLVTKTTKDTLSVEEENLLLAINSLNETGQIRLLEKTLFLYECLQKEKLLLEEGFDKYINSDYIDILLEKLNQRETNDKRIFLCDLEEFPRLIPKDVVAKIKWCKDSNIFDDYYVLYTDYTRTSDKIANGKDLGKKEQVNAKSKDPIVFGVFTKHSKDKGLQYLNEKFFYIADWVDEYCDLTLEKIMKVDTEAVKNLYDIERKTISKEDIQNLEGTEIGKAMLEKLNSLDKRVFVKKAQEKNKGILSKLVKVFTKKRK